MEKSQVLEHLGIVADGNRRWAKERGLPTIEGHKKGLEVIEALVGAAGKAGIKYLTFYVFSTENWGRSADEVGYIMKLAEGRILKYAEKLAKNNAKMVVLGSRNKISPTLASLIEKAEKITADCTGITVCFCFNYGGEQEIADAAAIAASEGEITPETIRKHLYHPEIPDIDMVVRTSGEERISGFMLWRAAYAELMFIEKYFPDMEPDDIKKILENYEKRNRRFGK
ncbi:di-trans,poly-cis-decaprenylcistransferase [Candidatus Saccharibacteria bacterium]|nr:di-trans,poly-cis-decaprenylcistransferase [Candidatus Saccharibacteria bacterium]